jgi:hypothetical protein
MSVMRNKSFYWTLIVLTLRLWPLNPVICDAFTIPQRLVSRQKPCCTIKSTTKSHTPLYMAEDVDSNQVLELADEEASSTTSTSEQKVVAPFLSQGEISQDAMEMDWKDPKQARVMFYIILSLLPVLFLIPLMLGSRELIPQDLLPPVEM